MKELQTAWQYMCHPTQSGCTKRRGQHPGRIDRMEESTTLGSHYEDSVAIIAKKNITDGWKRA